MSQSIHQQSVGVYTRFLNNLLAILDKAVANAEARKFDPAVLFNARLAPDMFPLARQVMIVTDQAKGAAARLAGVEVPSFPDTEANFGELKARVQKTLDFLATLKPEQFADAYGRTITVKIPNRELKFRGEDYLNTYALPNFYFHLTTSYAILRAQGVDLGKFDYLGSNLPLLQE
ncbi:DUF1993 domain-containing protein [Massilia sp. TS11]|uniref:DUF1993 domain-containing protein n=1 Tax=Massilia sp. TS11 TaxID=2908003 RepID=UPI001EDC33A1|nr:DUF1993 domain-containing protein [Massilia sp. TS11]